jgi:hypothetical protein
MDKVQKYNSFNEGKLFKFNVFSNPALHEEECSV